MTDDQTPEDEQIIPAEDEAQEPAQVPEGEPETFPLAYVQKLRKEAGDARVKVQDRDALAQRLHTSLVASTGRLADPSDLPFSEDHLADPDALNIAIDQLLAAKPHLATRRPRGDIGQGRMSDAGATVDLAALLRSRA